MTAHTDITKLAGQILTELETAVEAGEELRRENRGIGTRLRLLLTMTYACEGPIHDARLDILQAIGRTEVSDEMRRGGACHVGAERAVRMPADVNLPRLIGGLRALAEL